MPYKREGSPYYQIDLDLDGYPYRIGARTTKARLKRAARKMEDTLRDLGDDPDLGHEALDAIREGRLSVPQVHAAYRNHKLHRLLRGEGDPPLEEIVETFKTDHTDRRYADAMDRLLEVAPEGAPASWLLDHQHVQEIARYYRENEYAAATEQREMAGVSMLIRHHFGDGTREDVWESVHVRRPDNNAASPLTRAQVKEVRRTILSGDVVDPEWWTVFGLVIATGLRRSEFFRLEVGHVYLEEGRLFVPTGKSERARRRIPLEGEPLRRLRRWVAEQSLRDADPVFPGLYKGKVYRAWHAIREELGLEGIRFHDLRHTYGRMCAEGGMPIQELKAYMGHEKIETTMRYSTYRPNDRETYRKGLEKFGLREASPTISPTMVSEGDENPDSTGDSGDDPGKHVASSA